MLSEKNIHTYTHTTNVIGGIFCLKVSGVLAESCKQTKKLAYRIIHLFYPLSQVKIRRHYSSWKAIWVFFWNVLRWTKIKYVFLEGYQRCTFLYFENNSKHNKIRSFYLKSCNGRKLPALQFLKVEYKYDTIGSITKKWL